VLYRNFKGLELISRHHKVLDMYEDSLPSEYLRKPDRSVSWQSTNGTPLFEWEEGVKENVGRLLRCRNWKLTSHAGTVWRQILWNTMG